MKRVTLGVVAAFLLSPGAAPARGDPWPASGLFGAPDILVVELVAPFGKLVRERREKRPYHDATLRVSASDGTELSVPVRVKTRGRFRLDRKNCSFPPLKLNFAEKDVGGTMFAGLHKLKLVTHCKDKMRYEDYVVREYLAYRTYNLLTEHSFRVRRAEITYRDSESKKTRGSHNAFFIEEAKVMAARNGLELLERPSVKQAAYSRSALALAEVFQYLIGNTDYSFFAGTDGRCCHNAKLLGRAGEPLVPVAYDFDFSGMVETDYAQPAEKLPIRRVSQRLYRGGCWSRAELANVFEIFRARRDAIYALYRGEPDLSHRRLVRSLRYLDQFYSVIDDSSRVDRKLRGICDE